MRQYVFHLLLTDSSGTRIQFDVIFRLRPYITRSVAKAQTQSPDRKNNPLKHSVSKRPNLYGSSTNNFILFTLLW